MLHPDLTISGKSVTDEQELKSYFQQEDLVCTIGDRVLSMLRDCPGGIPTFLGLDTPKHGYFFENPIIKNGDDPFAVLFGEKPIYRYSEEDFWKMVLYFCQTGKRPVGADWENGPY